MIRASALAAALAVLHACSWFRDKPPEYLESGEAPQLAVPDDLDPPRYRSPLIISAPEMRLPAGDELNPDPPRVVSTQGTGDAKAFMAWSAEGVYLHVRDTPEDTAARLGDVIERSGMRIMASGDNGSYRFEYEHVRVDNRSLWQKLTFWSNDLGPDHSGFYRTRVEADEDNPEEARVYLLFDSGESATTDAAEHILGIFMDRLG